MGANTQQPPVHREQAETLVAQYESRRIRATAFPGSPLNTPARNLDAKVHQLPRQRYFLRRAGIPQDLEETLLIPACAAIAQL